MAKLSVEVPDKLFEEAAQKRIKELQTKIKKLEGEIGKLTQENYVLKRTLESIKSDSQAFLKLKHDLVNLIADQAYSEARERFDNYDPYYR